MKKIKDLTNEELVDLLKDASEILSEIHQKIFPPLAKQIYKKIELFFSKFERKLS